MLDNLMLSRRRMLTGSAALAGAGFAGAPAFAKGPILGTPAPYFYRFKLGSAEATIVSDGPLPLGDPHKNFTFSASALHSAIDYCTYDGITVAGYPRTTISRGEVIVEDGEFFGQPGRGRFIARGAV